MVTKKRAQKIMDLAGLKAGRLSRASEQIYKLGLKASLNGNNKLASDLFYLSNIIHERRHAVIQYGLSGGKGNKEYNEHVSEINRMMGFLPE